MNTDRELWQEPENKNRIRWMHAWNFKIHVYHSMIREGSRKNVWSGQYTPAWIKRESRINIFEWEILSCIFQKGIVGTNFDIYVFIGLSQTNIKWKITSTNKMYFWSRIPREFKMSSTYKYTTMDLNNTRDL
jgi:hypothetical protein